MEIRIANVSDIDDIMNLEKQYPHEQYSKSTIEKTLNDKFYVTIVAIEENKIVGYLSATIIFDECNLIKIIVDESCKRRGIGKALLQFLKNICRRQNIRGIYLEVREDNIVAKTFYENFGFKKESVRKAYYNGIDCEIYWNYLND